MLDMPQTWPVTEICCCVLLFMCIKCDLSALVCPQYGSMLSVWKNHFLHRLNACISQQTMNKIALTFLNSEWVALTRDFMKMTYCHFVFTVWTNVGTPQQRRKKTSDSLKKKIYYSKKKNIISEEHIKITRVV